MPFSRGDILLALFPDSNLRTAKKRPVLVVQGDGLATGLSQTIVAMITVAGAVANIIPIYGRMKLKRPQESA
jgi:mRNA-degrading endonuclease toxin of MazEF toxin-antitoxin module